MTRDATHIGTVQDVNGATVLVALSDETVTGLSFVSGEGYRIGQVGSFVRIPLGHIDLYAVVSHVGAGAVPARDVHEMPFGRRWIRVQLVGESRRGKTFERGVSVHPTIDDPVHIVTERDLRAIYGAGATDEFVNIGSLASAESVPVLIDVNKLVTRHSAVVGATGSGKSTTVAGLLRALSNSSVYPSARILLFDVHGEYARSLQDRCVVFRATSDETSGVRKLCVPYWALTFGELVRVLFGSLNDSQSASIADFVLQLKRDSLAKYPRAGVDALSLTVDTPVPFSVRRLWFELHRREHQTLVPKPGGAAEDRIPAYVLDSKGQPVQPGDEATVVPPIYRTVKSSGTPDQRVQHGGDGIGIRSQLAALAGKLRDPRYAFLLNPAEWAPSSDGKVVKDVDDLLRDLTGGSRAVVVLDLSGVPSSVLTDMVSVLLRIVYDALFWARNLPEGGRERPLLVVLEEAHQYLTSGAVTDASVAIRRIAKEGRKYGVGLMLVSQRPSDIDQSILSQCGTLFSLRLSNDADRTQVANSASDGLKGLFEMLPVLRTGEAVIVGEAVNLPMRAVISAPPRELRPDSFDPKVAVRGSLSIDGFDGPGGWNQKRDEEDYRSVALQWRAQTAKYRHEKSGLTTSVLAANDSVEVKKEEES